MRKIYVVSSLVILGILLQSGVKFSSVPPSGHTGATGVYCNNCHTSALNSGGGSITVNGLPGPGGYVPGQAYPFSITITHGMANRTRWGFSISANSENGTAVGTFSSSNAEAATNDQELSHLNATIKAASNTFTYNNLIWTAPAIPPSPNNNVTFFYVGNAANGGGSSGDFIYSGSTTIALPIDLKDFSASVKSNRSVALQWVTVSETNSDYFEVEKSDDNQFFYTVTKVYAAGNSNTAKAYSYTDKTVSSYNRPVYYRLKLMDKDGKFKLSKTVSVTLTGGKTFVENVYPSMVKANGLVNAEIASSKIQRVQIQLFDISGKLLQTYSYQLAAGSNLVTFRMPAAVPQQWVFAKFTTGSASQTMPLVVQP